MKSLRSIGFNEGEDNALFEPDFSDNSRRAPFKEMRERDHLMMDKEKDDRLHHVAKDTAHRMLRYRDRTSHELAQKLREKAFTEDVISAVITDLQRVGMLDDERFAEHWIRYQVENRCLGPIRLRHELIKKGFSPQEVDRFFECLTGEWDPVLLARRALLKRYKTLNHLQELALRRRAFSFLQRKGFSAELISRVFRNAARRNEVE